MDQIDTSRTLSFERNRSPKLVLLTAAFLVLGLWFVASPDTFADTNRARGYGVRPEIAVTIIGALCALMGAGGLVASVRHLRAEGDALLLSPSGLRIKVGTTKLPELPWNEVEGIQVVTVSGNDFLGIFVSQPERVIDRFRGPVRRLVAWQAKQYGTPVFFAASLVKSELPEVIAALDAYRAAYSRQVS